MNIINIRFEGPFAFFPDQSLPLVFTEQSARKPGLYLWAAPTDAGMKIAYVGKAGGDNVRSKLGDRLWTELKNSLAGRYQQVVDLDEWAKGFRRVLKDYGAVDRVTDKTTLEQICRNCVGFLAVVESSKRVIERAEALLIRRLKEAYSGDVCLGYAPFLSNRNRGRDPGELQVRCHADGILGLPSECVIDRLGIVPGSERVL